MQALGWARAPLFQEGFRCPDSTSDSGQQRPEILGARGHPFVLISLLKTYTLYSQTPVHGSLTFCPFRSRSESAAVWRSRKEQKHRPQHFPTRKTAGSHNERWNPGNSELTTKQITDRLKIRPVACYTQSGDAGVRSRGGRGQNPPPPAPAVLWRSSGGRLRGADHGSGPPPASGGCCCPRESREW